MMKTTLAYRHDVIRFTKNNFIGVAADRNGSAQHTRLERHNTFMKQLRFYLSVFAMFFATLQQQAYGQEQKEFVPDGTDGLMLEVRSDSAAKQIEKLPPNEFEGSQSSMKIGLGLIYDFSAYAKSDVFKAQMDSAGLDFSPAVKLRDFRVLGSGRFKTKRTISWKFAFMWDGDNETWLVRESGL